MNRTSSLALSLLFLSAAALPALAHDEPTNLKVIAKDISEKDLEQGMKAFNKGLGTKCEACHVKGKMDKDDVKEKDLTREFFKKVIGNEDAAVRKAALDELLKVMKLAAAKDEAKLWEGIGRFKKQ